MKVTKTQLRQIIKEELAATLNEAHGMSAKDADKLDNLISILYDKESENEESENEESEMERILKFLTKSNVEVDRTQDITKMKKGD